MTEDYEDIDVKLDYSANNLAALDRFGRVTDQVWADYGSTPETFDEFTYAYNRAGNRTARTNALHTAFNETYSYNDLDELTSSSRSDGYDQSWTLDGLGNWSGYNDDGTAQTRTTNMANEITATTGIGTPTYDRAGNMTVIPSPTSGNPTRTLGGKYDAWDRMAEVTDGGSSVAKFVYDGNGRRIEQLTNFVDGVPQNATHYYLSGPQVIETHDGAPSSSPESLDPKYQNVWSARYVDALVLRDTYDGGVLQTDSRLYYLSDANANVTAVVGKVSNAWQVVERYVYSPFGEATIYTPDWSSTRATSSYNNTTLFAGRELDVSTGLYYNRARYYSPSLGAFVGRDPIEYGGGDANLYRYVRNRATNETDPNGQAGFSPPMTGDAWGTRLASSIGTMFRKLLMCETPEEHEARMRRKIRAMQRKADLECMRLHPDTAGFQRMFTGERPAVFSGPVDHVIMGAEILMMGAPEGLAAGGVARALESRVGMTAEDFLWRGGRLSAPGALADDFAVARMRVQIRAAEIKVQLGRAHDFGETYALGAVRTKDGTIKYYVASKSPCGVANVNNSLQAGEELVGYGIKSDLHAEMLLERITDSRGETLLGVGATRPMCKTYRGVPWCQKYFDTIGVPVWTPRKP